MLQEFKIQWDHWNRTGTIQKTSDYSLLGEICCVMYPIHLKTDKLRIVVKCSVRNHS